MARGEPTDIGGDAVLREVLMCHRRNALPWTGGLNDQPWDFCYWIDTLDGMIAEHQALMAKLHPQN